jgi:diguanylate cyclase (GGDEF)-like protein
LVDLGLENINYRINISLKEIGEYFNIDRSYIFMLNESGKLMSNQYEWAAPGISSQKEKLQDLKTKNYQWWFKNLRNKDVIIIEDVDRLEAEAAAEKKLLKAQNIKSLIVFPIYIEDKITGFFGFDLVENKIDINEIKIEQLKIFTDVITNALSKHQDNLKIKKLSYYDSLTDIYNRRFFEEELKRLDTARQLPISIIMADLNGLKIINDSYGHKMGDYVLKRAAELLKKSIRKEDILARQGGDEFVILLAQTNPEEAAKIIRRIKNKTGMIEGTSIPISIALGQATKTDKNEEIDEILKDADNQMYKNKLSESRSSKSNIVAGLINALEAKSNETKEHALRMKNIALKFAEKLKLSESEKNRLSLLAELHDIGKINISEEILNKPDRLNQKEWEIIKKHTEQGYKIASSSEEFAAVADDIYAYHERWDGTGYPRQLEGE